MAWLARAWSSAGLMILAGLGLTARVQDPALPRGVVIDRVAVAWDVRRLEPRTIPLATVTAGDGSSRPDVADMLRRADERRLETEPGQRYRVTFDVGRAPQGTRTYLLAAKGYYVEWVRGRWLAAAKDRIPPADEHVRPIAGRDDHPVHVYRVGRDDAKIERAGRGLGRRRGQR